MEKGAQIVTDLYEIQDVVQRYTDIISIIADVDVEVVDEHLVRIAGTGLFADVVNKDMSGEGYVYRKVLATGERSVIYQPGEEIICRADFWRGAAAGHWCHWACWQLAGTKDDHSFEGGVLPCFCGADC